MQKLFADLVCAGHTYMNGDGTNCPDLPAAQEEARPVLRELCGEALVHDPLFEPIGIHIRNASREQLAYIPIADAIDDITDFDR